MNTLVYTLLILLTMLVGLAPLFKKVIDLLGTSISHKQFDLLRKLVEEAVSYANQTSLDKEISSEEKKELAMSTAQALADTFEIPKDKQLSINSLIESVLWTEEEPTTEDTDDFDD